MTMENDLVERRVELVTNALLHLPVAGAALQLAARQVEMALRPEIQALEAELARKTEALNRQSDNMAFIINNIGMPNAWLTKFMRELDEDRAVAARSALEEKTDV